MGFFQKLKQGLSKTRGGLTDRVDELVENTREIDDDFYDQLALDLRLNTGDGNGSDNIFNVATSRKVVDRLINTLGYWSKSLSKAKSFN